MVVRAFVVSWSISRAADITARRDKPLQWIVFANGEAGFIGEHSCMDGTPLLRSRSCTSLMQGFAGTPTARLNDFISKRLITNKPTVIGAADPAPSAQPKIAELKFELDPKALGMIESATKEFAEHVGQFEVFYLKYGRYGKDGIKAMKTSPDGWCVPRFPSPWHPTNAPPPQDSDDLPARLLHDSRPPLRHVRSCPSSQVPARSHGDRSHLYSRNGRLDEGDAR